MSALFDLLHRASPPPWCVVGPPWNEGAPYLLSGGDDPHVGEFVCDFVNFARDDEGPVEAQRAEQDAELVCWLVNHAQAVLDLEKAGRELVRQLDARNPHGTLIANAREAVRDALAKLGHDG